MIVTNVTDTPIFITVRWAVNPFGGPAIQKQVVCVEPGKQIDLSVVGLEPTQPKLSDCDSYRRESEG